MAKVPSLPSTGQPIDTQYIYDIVNSLISINAELSTNGSSNIKIQNEKYPVSKTSSLNFDAQTVNVVNSEKVITNGSKSGQLAFSTAFSKVPVVTATVVSKSTTNIPAVVTITNVDKTTVYYKITFLQSGTTTVDLSFIAIGT